VPLIPPALDDRSYDDLVQEMLANIPAHTPEWTNPQVGDPGRTMLELVAWLADTILYRANLIPEKQRLAFLKLLGQPMQPAAPAHGIITLSLDSASVIPSSLLAAGTVPGPVQFETLGEIDLLPVTGQAYIKLPLTPDQQAQQMALLTGLQQLYQLKNLPAGYTTTPLFSNGLASSSPIDITNGTTDQSLWIALLAGDAKNVAKVTAALGSGSGRQLQLNVSIVPALSLPDPFADIGPRAAVQAMWQMTEATSASQPPIYNTLKVVDDTTQGLTRPGIVRLVLPSADHIGAPTNDVHNDPQAGVALKPPRIDDPDIQSKLVTWVRLSVNSAFQISWAGINAVEVDQRTSYSFVPIAVSDGSADQQFALQQTQIDPATFVLEVDMPGSGFQPWKAVDDLAVQQGPVPAYVLDPEAGTVSFGNQMQGMIPPGGRRIRARQMRAGGGAAGNLPPRSLTSIKARDASGNPVAQKITVIQPIATTGGANSETLDQVERRLPSLLQHQERAVTASDYKSLAMEVPGADVARVEVLPLFKPQTRKTDTPGVVSVMVIPDKGGVQPPCPRADRPLLETVYQYLDSRRPATAEMYVIATEYIPLGISVAVEVRTGFGQLQVSTAVETALRNYLWPIAPGGSDNQGWPLGRRVRSLELEVIVSRVPGVVEVNGLNLFTPLPAGGYQQIGPELDLLSWQLPEVLEVSVAAGADGSGIQPATDLRPQPAADPAIAVPTVPKVC
jgi:Baseplate J-like protein